MPTIRKSDRSNHLSRDDMPNDEEAEALRRGLAEGGFVLVTWNSGNDQGWTTAEIARVTKRGQRPAWRVRLVYYQRFEVRGWVLRDETRAVVNGTGKSALERFDDQSKKKEATS